MNFVLVIIKNIGEENSWQKNCTHSRTHSRNNSKKTSPSNSIVKKNNRGFSLLELMILAAMLGGLSLVVMNITKQSNKASAKLQFDSDVTLTTNEINGILSDPAKCLATFTIPLQTTAPTNINGKYYISTEPSAPAKGYGNSGLKIASFTLSGTATAGVLTINYQNKNILKGSSGSTTVSKKINIYFEGTLTPTNITKCRSLSSSTTDIWSRVSPTGSSDIYYNSGSGNVGVGTTSPGQKLEIDGGFALNTTTPKPFCINSLNRGTLWFTKGISGTKDSVEVCSKNAANSYAWSALDGGSGGGGVTVCPTGTTMVGDPGKLATYCIDTVARDATYSHMTILLCNYSLNLAGTRIDELDGYGHLCTYTEWTTACIMKDALKIPASPEEYEWIPAPRASDTHPWETMMGVGSFGSSSSSISCTKIQNKEVGDRLKYRCCFRHGLI